MITKRDYKEVPMVVALENKIDNMNAESALRISDEIFVKQPFFLSLMLGYHPDTTPLELDEIMKV